MNAQEKIADKIRRLLALSESSNEHEAALAASKAQELILKYAVSQEAIRASGGKSEDEGPIEPEAFGDYRGRIPDWHTSLMTAMEASFMVDTYYTAGRRLWVVGRPTARAAFIQTHNFLVAQIDQLMDAAWKKVKPPPLKGNGGVGDYYGRYERAERAGEARRWKRSFALGAVTTVRQRLALDRKALNEKAERAALPHNAAAPLAIEARQTALVLRSHYDEAQAWTKAHRKELGLRTVSRQGASSSDGYAQGRAAGHALNISHGRAKALGGK